MKRGRVIGSIVLTKAIYNLDKERLIIISNDDNKVEVGIDRLHAGLGRTVLCAVSKEALFALGEDLRPIDLATVGIVDE